MCLSHQLESYLAIDISNTSFKESVLGSAASSSQPDGSSYEELANDFVFNPCMGIVINNDLALCDGERSTRSICDFVL